MANNARGPIELLSGLPPPQGQDLSLALSNMKEMG